MAHISFLHHLHLHAQHVDRAPMLAASLRDAVPSLCYYTESLPGLYARAGAPGKHYLLVEGRSQWLLRFFSQPHCSQISGVVALVSNKVSSAERARLMLADVDICLPGSAQVREIVAALSVLSRMERRIITAAMTGPDDGLAPAVREFGAKPGIPPGQKKGRPHGA